MPQHIIVTAYDPAWPARYETEARAIRQHATHTLH